MLQSASRSTASTIAYVETQTLCVSEYRQLVYMLLVMG
jgi:hypothetical protein